MDKKIGKSDAQEKSDGEYQGENPPHYWRKVGRGSFQSLIRGGWIQNTYCGICVTLILAFIITFFMSSKQAGIIGFGLGVTGLFWLVIIAVYFEVGRSKTSSEQDPARLVNIEPNQATNGDEFTDTKFIITNQTSVPIYNVGYFVEFWDGDMPNNIKPEETFGMLCDSTKDILDPNEPMSARVDLGPIKDTKIKEKLFKIKRPFCQFWVSFNPTQSSSEKMEIGRRFWAQQNRLGVYFWNPAGNAKHIKANEPLPRLNPQ